MIAINESSRMSAYMPATLDEQARNVPTDKAKSTDRRFSVLSLPLSEEEKEQKLDTVDNGTKTAEVLNRSGKFGPSSEQVAVTHTVDELDRFTEKLFNLPLAEIELSRYNQCYFVSGLFLTTAEGPESTPENPIMYVTTGNVDDTEGPDKTRTWYKVYVNQVNPGSATREEMFALITYEYGDDEEALNKATYAFHGLDPCALLGDGPIDYMKLMKEAFALSERAYKGGDMRAKQAYEALLDMIDRLEKRADPQAKPAQALPAPTSIYHKYAAEKAKAGL